MLYFVDKASHCHFCINLQWICRFCISLQWIQSVSQSAEQNETCSHSIWCFLCLLLIDVLLCNNWNIAWCKVRWKSVCCLVNLISFTIVAVHRFCYKSVKIWLNYVCHTSAYDMWFCVFSKINSLWKIKDVDLCFLIFLHSVN